MPYFRTFCRPIISGQIQYLDIAINNLRLNIPIFNTHRMVAEYAVKYGIKLDPAVEGKMEECRKLYSSNIENN